MTGRTVTVPAPVVAHPGPEDTPAQFMADAAWKLRNGYPAGGSNVCEAIAKLLDDVALELDPDVTTAYAGRPSAAQVRRHRFLTEEVPDAHL